MTATNITAQQHLPNVPLTVASVAPDATNGNNIIVPTGRLLLLKIVNTSGAAVSAILTDVGSVSPANATTFNPNVTLSIAAGATASVLVTDMTRFRNPNTGGVLVTLSTAASVTVGASYI